MVVDTCCVCFCKRKRGWKCPSCNARAIHFFCLADWLKSGNSSCPLCRAKIGSDEIAKVMIKVSRKTQEKNIVAIQQ